jgi:hypothetical protein
MGLVPGWPDCPDRYLPVAQMSHASAMTVLINRIIYKIIIILTFTGKSVENCGCSVLLGAG